MRRIPELLAPAGSREALEAAIAAGADAVYLSGKRFGARKFSANFDDESLGEAIDYAHLRGVRVYVTVNTLIRENEIDDVGEYLVRLYRMGADAVLLQDLGIALLASRIVPELERHASTQMTIHNAPGLLWAQRAGFKRAVLAREVSLNEIKEINPQGIGVEVFIHGALCYSYSGQCLLSSAIGGRSGNRGMCAQPCRKPYVLLKGEKDQYGRPMGLSAQPQKERFLISTRDLCTYRHLDRIVRSPVCSLKIEGRMKSPEYVAIVTGIYRKALDAIAAGKWAPSAEDERDLALAFNRSFTEGHLLESKDVMGREASDNRGVLVGSVASFDTQKGEAAVRLSGPLCPEKGDGLVFQAPGQEVGLVVQKVVQKDGMLRLMTPERIKPGARVYLTGSTALAKKAQKIIASGKTEIALDISLTWQEGRPVAEALLNDAKSISVTASFQMEKAKNQPTTRQQIESQLRRTGGTPFVVRKISMDYNEDLFAPLSALNQLRRDLLEKVKEALLEKRRPSREKVEMALASYREMKLEDKTGAFLAAAAQSAPAGRGLSLAVYADSLETVRGAIDGGCDRVYFEPILGNQSERSDRTDRAAKARKLIEEAAAICANGPLIWKWPRITCADFFSLAGPMLAEAKFQGIMVENVGALQAALNQQPGIHLYGGMGLNVCNHLTVQALAPPLEFLTLSPELSARQLAGIVAAVWGRSEAPCLELVVQGSLEVMVAEDCVPCLAREKPEKGSRAIGEHDTQEFWGLQDMRRIFPLRLDDEFRTHIFNSAETCLLDLMPEIISTGLCSIAVDARGRTEEYARRMTAAYRKAIDLTEKGGDNLRQELQGLKEAIVPLTLGGITHGHFVKGLKDEIS